MTAEEFLNKVASLIARSGTAPGVVDAFLTGLAAGMLTPEQRKKAYERTEAVYG